MVYSTTREYLSGEILSFIVQSVLYCILHTQVEGEYVVYIMTVYYIYGATYLLSIPIQCYICIVTMFSESCDYILLYVLFKEPLCEFRTHLMLG